MDVLRGEEDREVNHHGTTRTVGGGTGGNVVLPFSGSELRHRDEQKELKARKEYYKQIKQKEKNKSTLNFCKKIGKQIIPTVCILFAVFYWSYGLSQL